MKIVRRSFVHDWELWVVYEFQTESCNQLELLKTRVEMANYSFKESHLVRAIMGLHLEFALDPLSTWCHQQPQRVRSLLVQVV
eukprot:COSAG02_NODE_45730_length_354_cov_1.180392_1_plen_82_part_01